MGARIAAVLLVPHDGDEHGLLAEGPCGARPPTAHWFRAVLHDGTVWQRWDPGPRDNWRACEDNWGEDYKRALALAWDGEALHIATPWLPGRCNHAVWLVVAGLRGEGWSGLYALVKDYSLGTLVLLGAEWREVTDV
jgi:hypothetical protein